jgi:hypothetical protein
VSVGFVLIYRPHPVIKDFFKFLLFKYYKNY